MRATQCPTSVHLLKLNRRLPRERDDITQITECSYSLIYMAILKRFCSGFEGRFGSVYQILFWNYILKSLVSCIIAIIQCMDCLKSLVRGMDESAVKAILESQSFNEKCDVLHPGDCNVKACFNFVLGARAVLKIYLLAHFVPLLFKLKRLRKAPRQELQKALLGLVNSLLFAAFTNAISRRMVCLFVRHASNHFTITPFPAIISGVSLFFESPGRQAEIALYCVSKAWEAAYAMLRRRNYPVSIPCGNLWLNGISIAVVAFAFLNEPSLFREGYRNALGLILSDI